MLLDAIYHRYGYDFRSYARASLKRRVHNHLNRQQIPGIAELIPIILRDEEHFQSLLFDISVTVTEMFRDPWFFERLKDTVFPYLSTFPFVNIWQAGCATGEEVYSLAILLKEANLYPRCRIYATDINEAALDKARQRIYALTAMKDYSRNYQQAGGEHSLSNYYIAQYDAAIIDPQLQDKVTFAVHNLATDSPFGEMHLILCRNVLIYFDRKLQNRALKIFRSSLRRGGFLCLGSRDSLDFSTVKNDFIERSRNERIYQYKGTTAPLRLPSSDANGGKS